MAPQREKVDLEQILGQAILPRANPSVRTLPTAAIGTVPWRLVAADGSTKVFDLASPADRPDNAEPVGNAQVPIRPQLPEMLAAGAEQSPPGGGQGGRIAEARSPDPARVLATGGECVLGRGGPSKAVATTSNHCLAKPIMPPQVSAGCRDIDSQLARIINLWPELPQSIQAAMLAMIEVAREHP